MQNRHRIPTIFNLSMVDVLCCALGCVILLWLLNLKEAKQRATTVGQTTERLHAVEHSLDETSEQLRRMTQARGEALARETAAARLRDLYQQERDASRSRADQLARDLAALQMERERLAKNEQATARQKLEADKRLARLEMQLKEQYASARDTARHAEELAAQLHEAEAQAKKSKTDLEAARLQLAEIEARAKALEELAGSRKKDLTDASRSLEVLQRENKVLAEQVTRARAAADNRFEGIALTGRRVAFLVDMSGSMELVDERTPDANKWVGVRETLAKIMRSLPDLEKFQVILFSDRITYLLGEEGRWIDFDPKSSVQRVSRALASIKPQGNTNMHDVMEAAFRLRPQGLDTIYVLSDGLPNVGPGLTQDQQNTLDENARSAILAKYIRGLLTREWNRPLPGQPKVRINTVGFFYESPDVGAFLWALARENDGSFVGMSRP